jgi:hypothetical protein
MKLLLLMRTLAFIVSIVAIGLAGLSDFAVHFQRFVLSDSLHINTL